MKIYAESLKTFVDFAKASMSFQCSRKALEALETLKNGDYVITITQPAKKRTAQQNRYLWELLGQISAKENGNRSEDVEIYCQLVEQAGAKCEYLMGLPGMEDRLKQVFRVVKIVDDRLYNGRQMNVYKCFYGSSKLDTREMGILIDKTIERAEADGIDTDYYRRLLIEDYDKQFKNR